MNTAAKLINPINKTNLVVAHMAGTPFYYVEEAEIGHSKVSVSFFNENDPASEIENTSIPTKDLIGFTNEFYRGYTDGWDQANDIHVQERLPMAGLEYLKENLNSVVTDYLNAKGVNHA